MAAFNERLKELNPAIRTTRESSARYMPYMGNNKGLDAQRDRTLKTAESVRAARLIPDRLMKSLFSDPEFVKREVKKPRKLMEMCIRDRRGTERDAAAALGAPCGVARGEQYGRSAFLPPAVPQHETDEPQF